MIDEEVLWHNGVGHLRAGTNRISGVGIELGGGDRGIVGEVELVAQSGIQLDELLRGDEIKSTGDVLCGRERVLGELIFLQWIRADCMNLATYRNADVEDADESVGTATSSFPANLGAKVIAHTDAGTDASLVHDTGVVTHKLKRLKSSQ